MKYKYAIIAILLVAGGLWFAYENIYNFKIGGDEALRTDATVINFGLKRVQNMELTVTAPRKMTLTKGTTIYMKELVTDIPILSSQASFFCEDAELCGTDGPLKVESQKITLSNSVNSAEAYVVVCRLPDFIGQQSEAKYCIALNRDPSKATATCTKNCGSQ